MWANFDESWPFQPLNPGCPTSITPFLSSQPLPPAIAAPDYINMFSRSSFRSLLCSDPYTKIRHGHRNVHRETGTGSKYNEVGEILTVAKLL